MGKTLSTLNLLNQWNALNVGEKVTGLFPNISRVKSVLFNKI